MNILIKKLRKNRSKIAAMAVISAVVVVIILVSRVRVDANNSYGRDYSDKRYKNYTVTSGDTLWDIASRSTASNVEASGLPSVSMTHKSILVIALMPSMVSCKI